MGEEVNMNITQKFYDKLASQYDKLFLNWQDATKEQAAMLDKIFRDNGFDKQFDIIIAMDNALPHMLTNGDLTQAIESIIGKLVAGGLFVASIRDYDDILRETPPYSPPYVHKTGKGQRVSFQTWDWEGERYKLTQYIIDDQETLQISKFQCEYRATTREELTKLLVAAGCREVAWKFPEETGFYQPMVVAKK